VAAAPAVPAGPKEETIEIGKGDTLAGVLNEAGLSAEDSHRAVESLRGHYDPRRLRPGQKLHIRYDPLDDQGSNYQFVAMQFDKDPLELVTLTRGTGDNFETSVEKRDVEERVHGKKARIQTSLYGSALKAGIPASVIAEAIRAYSWDVDFQRDIKQGDSLEVMYSQNETSEGVKVGGGNILYANLVVGGNRIPVYRYKNEFGDDEFYKEDGSSVRKALLKTPIDGARLSSGFGYRRHPVLGYNKLHKGTDFAAPRGTPIFAAGSGVVEMAGPFSSYGNYVRIRHNGEYKTAYAHMQRFAPGIKSGQRVKQGQVIGYVGTTGRSTGPHLHFEVLKNNTQINPQGVKMQDSEKLKGPALVAFKARIGDLKQQYSQLMGRVKYASR